MAVVRILTLILVCLAALLLVIWVFRPGTKKNYNLYSKIPLQNDKNDNEEIQ